MIVLIKLLSLRTKEEAVLSTRRFCAINCYQTYDTECHLKKIIIKSRGVPHSWFNSASKQNKVSSIMSTVWVWPNEIIAHPDNIDKDSAIQIAHGWTAAPIPQLEECRIAERKAVSSEVVLKEVLKGEAPPRGPTPYPFIFHCLLKRYPISYTVYWEMVPLSHKYTVFIIWINRKTNVLCRLFHSLKMVCYPFWAFFTDGNDRFLFPIYILQQVKFLLFHIYLKPFRARSHRSIAHYSSWPAPFQSGSLIGYLCLDETVSVPDHTEPITIHIQ